MQSFQHHQMKKRRECRVYYRSDLLTSFQQANTRIISKFRDSSQYLADQGIKHLQQATAQYLGQRPNRLADFPTFQIPLDLHRTELAITKKSIIDQKIHPEQNHRGMTFSQHQEDEHFQDTCRFAVGPSQRKDTHFQSAIANKVMDSTTKKLSKSFKKLGIDERFYIDSDEQSGENTNQLNLPDLQGKSIIQIMEESNRKVQERIMERESKAEREEVQSDSSYPITDYSSNNSSNNNDYDEEVRESGFAKTESIASSQSYKPSNILYSPKKSKSQLKEKKRVYIREKKIPHWAEDLCTVSEMVAAQNCNPSIDPDVIYGRCIVQQLNTNLIFNSDAKLYRGSSAKWTRNQFIT